MTTSSRRYDVRTPEGALMFSVHLVDRDGAAENGSHVNGSNSPSHQRRPSDGDESSTVMSDSQRRYLFQILAERGTEGDAAHQQLKKLFGVDSLAAVGKQTARAMIQCLLQEESRCTDRR